MLKAIIVDDNPDNREFLSLMLKLNCPDINVWAQVEDVNDGISMIKVINPDIVFLDIELQRGSGFDILRNTTERNFDVIFTTAYDEYAIQAIKFSAVDYLLKPIDINELIGAVEKVKQNRNASYCLDNMQVLLDNISKEVQPLVRFYLPTQEGYKSIRTNDVIRFIATGKNTEMYCCDKKKYLILKPISYFSSLAHHHNFFKCNKDELINLNCIKRFLNKGNGTVIMADNAEIDLGQGKREELIRKMGYKGWKN